MLLVKTIPKSHNGPAWCAAFSIDGRFLATGGEDGNVCIWAVAPKSATIHPESTGKPQKDEKDFETPKKEKDVEMKEVGSDSPLTTDTDDKSAERVSNETGIPEEEFSVPPLNFVGSGPELATNLDIISSTPVQRFIDHTADVIDLSWSHTNFLLTASLDSSVRLYHYSKPQCLHLFKHANLVASVAFHPSDERYFISGGIDKKLRMWSITDGRVKDWAQAPDVITAVRFTPDGKYAVAGLFRGQVYFYESDGLKYCKSDCVYNYLLLLCIELTILGQ
jgi:WD40 repeat protein